MKSQWHTLSVRQKPNSVYTTSKTTFETIEIFTKIKELIDLAPKLDFPCKTIAIFNMYFNAKTKCYRYFGTKRNVKCYRLFGTEVVYSTKTYTTKYRR